MIAGWCQGMYSALETIECVFAAGNRHFKCFVVLIAANFTGSHVDLPHFSMCMPSSTGKMSSGENMDWLWVSSKGCIRKQNQAPRAGRTIARSFTGGTMAVNREELIE